NDGTMTVNVDGGNQVNDTVLFPGVADQGDVFQISYGDNNTTNAFLLRAGASDFTRVNVTGVGHTNVDGGGGAAGDVLSRFGTTGPDTFLADPTSALSGSILVGSKPAIGYFGLGTGGSEIDLVGDPAGATGATDTVLVNGTVDPDTYTYTPSSIGDGVLDL